MTAAIKQSVNGNWFHTKGFQEMNDYATNNEKPRSYADPPDPHNYNCPRCGGRYSHENWCRPRPDTVR